MKRISSIFTLLVLMLGLGMNAKAQTWDFTAGIPATDKALMDADANWNDDSEAGRYNYVPALANEALKASGAELTYAQGLKFTAGEATASSSGTAANKNAKIRPSYSSGKLYLNVNGTGVVITIPSLTTGKKVEVTYKTSSSSTARTLTPTNLKDIANFTATKEQVTGSGIVESDGDVTLTTTGGLYIYSIKVTTLGEGGGDDSGDDTPSGEDHSVSVNSLKNQAVLTLSDGTKKYYNTEDVKSIDFDNNNVKVVIDAQTNDAYNGNVTGVGFAKAEKGADIDNPEGAVEITEARGWLESAYVKFNKLDGAASYNVYIKGGNFSEYTKIDEQLVRDYGSYGRADVVGLKVASDYAIKVVPVKEDKTELTEKTSEATGINVKNYSRQGFAFMGDKTPGAYNSDGTLKSAAKVLYVTKNNFNTISLEMVKDNKGGTETYTGLGEIFKAKQKGYDKTPLAVRIIGTITTNDAASAQLMSDEAGLQLKGNGENTEMDVTLEGIGEDATLNGFGMTFYNGTRVEMRNLALINFKDDGVQLKGTQHAWIHHNDFFYGSAGSASDQAKGDGSLDVKDDSRYCTFSYNHFWDSGKTSLCGMKSESGPNYISYDHNWFDHSDSRHPRVRSMSVHVWNNYYDGVSKIGVGAVKGANIFVESNYFRNSKNPMLISEQGTDGRNGFADDHDGGMIKAYGNVLTGKSATTFIPHTQSATEFDAYVAETRNETVPSTYKSVVGSYTYNNFDTDASLMFSYEPDAAEDIPGIVTGYYGAGRLNHGDLQWTFNNNVDDAKDAVDSDLKTKVTNYKTTLVGIFGDENADSGEQGGEGGDQGGEGGGDQGGETPEGTITATFNGSPSNSMFTVGGSYGDGNITYNGTTLKKGVKLNSNGSITFTPTKDYNMTIVLATAKNGRDVKLNGTTTTVSGTENTEGKYYEMQPIAVAANTTYTITKGSAESIVMLIILEPVE